MATVHGLLPKLNKIKLSALAVAVLLSGCVTVNRNASTDEIRDIPEDCKNKTFFIGYLQNQLSYNKPPLKSQADHEATVTAIKTKIWRIRYVCQPV
jgi:hypothetical protein